MLKSPLFSIPKHSIIIIAQKEDSPKHSFPNKHIITNNSSPHRTAKKNETPFQKYINKQQNFGPKK